MNSTMIYVLLVMSVFIVACSDDSPPVAAPLSPSPTESEEIAPSQPEEQSSQGVSFEELSLHNSQEDCWVVYEGDVYDLTRFIPLHPGGVRAIESRCGTEDFQDAFTNKHGTSKIDLFMQESSKVGTYKG